MTSTGTTVERSAPDRLIIAGAWIDAVSGDAFETVDPATGHVIAAVSEAGAVEVDAAVKAARAALAGQWSTMDALANDTIHGLAAEIWTADVKRAHRMARRVGAGTVWINTCHPLDAASPFGGYTRSGYGRELGRYALDLCTQVKSAWADLN